jgi:hypothetical protein
LQSKPNLKFSIFAEFGTLRYSETIRKYEKGFNTRQYSLTFNIVSLSGTRKGQQEKIEKLSLVAFLNKDQRIIYNNICRRLKQENHDFYQNNNLHVILFGFDPLEKKTTNL